jgi:epsilon-lactone hydrolase
LKLKLRIKTQSAMPSIQSHLFRFYLKSQRGIDANASVSQQRADFEKATGRAKMPKGVSVRAAIVGGVPGEWIEPAAMEDESVILYLHGGGYMMGSPKTHRAMVARIAVASRARALLLDYRLAPEHPFPTAIEDAVAAYHALLDQGIAPEQIVFAGDSAGGGLVLAALLWLRDAGDPMPRAAVCISPFADFALLGESIITRAKADPYVKLEHWSVVKHCLGDNDPYSPLLSPLYGDLRGLPSLLIHVGNDEILLSDSTRLAERARDAGVDATLEVWPGMWHVWHFFAPILPEAQQAIDRIGSFVGFEQRVKEDTERYSAHFAVE